jgi:hypothetical protein
MGKNPETSLREPPKSPLPHRFPKTGGKMGKSVG